MPTIPDSPTPAHPVWCNRKHADDHPVHSVEVGSVDVTDTTSVEVYLFQSDGKPPTVSLTLACGEDDTLVDLGTWKAYELADLIKGAADALEGHWNPGGAS